MTNRKAVGKVQTGALWLLRRPLAHPPLTTALLAVAYIAGVPLSWWLYLAGTVIAVAAVALHGGEARKERASTLAGELTFAIRKLRLRMKMHRVMLHAGLSKDVEAHLEQVRHGMHGKLTPKLRKITRTPVGVSVVVDGSVIGKDDWEFQQKIHTLRSSFRCRDLFVGPFEGKEWWTELRLIYVDPFKRTILTSELPAPSGPGEVVVGLDEQRDAVEKVYWLPQFIAGTSGSGKSSEVRMQLLGLVRSGLPFITLVYDPKLMEFPDLKNKAFLYATDDFDKFLKAALDILAERQAALAANGFTECPTGDAAFPLIVMVIDELVTALMEMSAKGVTVKWKGKPIAAKDAFMAMLTVARAAGLVPIACTQLVQKEIIGALRDLFPYKTTMRMPGPESTRIMFGGGEGVDRMYPAHRLPATRDSAGIAWVDDNGRVRKYRGALPSEVERAEVAAGVGRWTEFYSAKTSEQLEELANA